VSGPYDARWFASRLGNVTRAGIAQETAALVRTGALPVGSKLPTVRDLAYALSVSPATISQAWATLRRHKIISGRGRHGSFIIGNSFSPRPARFLRGFSPTASGLNLSFATPDPALLPDLTQALAHGARAEGLNSYERVRILPALERIVRQTWPYDASAFLAMDGGYSAVYTLMHALVPPGAPVAIEDPTGLRLLDILEDMNVPILSIACDGEGPRPDSLAAALEQRPAMVIFQPRVHAVTGALLTPARLAALGDLLQASDALVVEDDGLGDVAEMPRHSLGQRIPDRVIHVLSYSKALGPDLRLAVLSASASIVEQIQSYRGFSAGWTSRILQASVAWLLEDEATMAQLAATRAIYRARREAFARELVGLGLPFAPGHGLCAFIPVHDAAATFEHLMAEGIAVVPGDRFSMGPINAIRIATSRLTGEEITRVARALAGHVRCPDSMAYPALS